MLVLRTICHHDDRNHLSKYSLHPLCTCIDVRDENGIQYTSPEQSKMSIFYWECIGVISVLLPVYIYVYFMRAWRGMCGKLCWTQGERFNKQSDMYIDISEFSLYVNIKAYIKCRQVLPVCWWFPGPSFARWAWPSYDVIPFCLYWLSLASPSCPSVPFIHLFPCPLPCNHYINWFIGL